MHVSVSHICNFAALATKMKGQGHNKTKYGQKSTFGYFVNI